jgi:hypothetical protein
VHGHREGGEQHVVDELDPEQELQVDADLEARVALERLEEHAPGHEGRLERHEHRHEREEASEQRDAVGDRRDGGDVAQADLALAPHEVSGEDGDEERHDRRQVAAQHRAGDQVRDGPRGVAEHPAADVPARGEHEDEGAGEDQQERLRRGDLAPGARGDGDRLPDAAPGVERARRGERARPDRRAPSGGGVDHGAAPAPPAARAAPPGCAKRKRATSSANASAATPIHSARFTSTTAGHPMSRAFCSAGVQYCVALRDRTAAEGVEQRLERPPPSAPAKSAATVPRTNSAMPPRYVARACRVSAAAANMNVPMTTVFGSRISRTSGRTASSCTGPNFPADMYGITDARSSPAERPARGRR